MCMSVHVSATSTEAREDIVPTGAELWMSVNRSLSVLLEEQRELLATSRSFESLLGIKELAWA